MRDMRSGFSKVNEIPDSMKQLIAEEMSKEVEDRQNSSNVVAKLMGLETLTQLHLEITTPPAASPSRFRSYSHCSASSVDSKSGKCHKQHREFEDIYEMCNSRKERCDEESVSDKQMALVRQKFIEAKQLVTADKFHQSKEFHDALGVLSSNKALFVKFLQESNSLFSQHLSDFHFQLVPPHPEAKRITVLRPKPSMAVDAQGKRCKQIKTSPSSNHRTEEQHTSEPTRIVVLKPSPRKSLDIKAIVSSPPNSPKILHSSGYLDEAKSREVAREITRQMRVNLTGHQREETVISSVLSNGSIGDDGSLNLWDIEHSWDCSNRDESPFSSSSFSRASFTPESSVYREAKKRLSERWAMISLNGGDTNQQKDLAKDSTVLGEMLTLSETKLHTRSYKESKQETRRSSSCISSALDQEEHASDSLNTLERSKSVPEISFYGTSKAQETTPRSLKSSWKVSNLFFFRNKKVNKEKTDRNTSQFTTDSLQQSIFSDKEELTTSNQDQPSPVSVLQALFEEEYHRNPECSGSTTTQGEETFLKPNLIDKSPRIGSIARVLDDSLTHTTRSSMSMQDNEDWYYFIKTLLTASGFNRNDGSRDPLMSKWWYSPNSPLDPSLIDNYTKPDNNHNKQLIHEAKRRKQRSNRKLIFDRINSIITETTTIGHKGVSANGDRFNMVEHVWTHFKDWFQDTVATLDTVATHLGGERVVREEVVGKLWSDGLKIEIEKLGIKIEIMLLQDLIEEAVFDLT